MRYGASRAGNGVVEPLHGSEDRGSVCVCLFGAMGDLHVELFDWGRSGSRALLGVGIRAIWYQ